MAKHRNDLTIIAKSKAFPRKIEGIKNVNSTILVIRIINILKSFLFI